MITFWEDALAQHWGIKANLTVLDGEYDLNFKADSGHVLKVMRAGCGAALIDMQTAALATARKAEPDLPLPEVMPARSGALFIELPDKTGTPRLCWLLSLVPGQPWADFRPHSAGLIYDLGANNTIATKQITSSHPNQSPNR